MVERTALRLSAALLVSGYIVGGVANVFHPSGVADNDHPAVFAQYAQSATWTTVHLAQFIATAILIAGLLVLLHALNLQGGLPRLVARVGIASAGVVLALTAIRYAVDGVVLKRAVDAWVSAPDAEKAARFASAEAIRWQEEAIVSYQNFVLGFMLILLAALILWTARVPRPIGYLLALGGVSYLVLGWITGVAGFAPEGAIPSMIGLFSLLISSVWVLITALRLPGLGALAPESGSPALRHDAEAEQRSR